MPRATTLRALRSPLVAGALSLATLALAARDPLANRQCLGGVCMANVDASESMAPCADANLVLAWSQGGQAIALQCMNDREPADQPIVVFQKRVIDAPSYELTGIRAFMPETLPQIAHASGDGNDALLSACRRPAPPTMAPGELLLTETVPSDSAQHPACYRVLRVASLADGGIAIRADDGKAPAPGRMSAEWRPLAWKMMGLVMAADARVLARVTRARAPLHDKPDPRSPVHGLLVAGDRVDLVARDTPSGMVLVGHVDAKGFSIARWIAQGDIALDAAR